jgi:hypothetical protein
MKMISKALLTLGALVALAGASSAQLINGGFESGVSPWVGGGFGTIAGTGGIAGGFSQTGANFYYLNDAPGTVVGVSQMFTVTGGSSAYTISGIYTSVGIGTGTNSFAVQVLDSANTVLQQATFNPTSTGYNANWRPFSTTTSPLIAGTYKVLFIGQANGFDDDYGIDNITATAVAPEPGTLALLGLAGIPGVALLRRKK